MAFLHLLKWIWAKWWCNSSLQWHNSCSRRHVLQEWIYLDIWTRIPHLWELQTPSKCSVQLLSRSTEKLSCLEVCPKVVFSAYNCYLFFPQTLLSYPLIIFLPLVSVEKEQAKLGNMVKYYPESHVLKEKLSRCEAAVSSSGLSWCGMGPLRTLAGYM